MVVKIILMLGTFLILLLSMAKLKQIILFVIIPAIIGSLVSYWIYENYLKK